MCNHELNTLYKVLRALRIEDVELYYRSDLRGHKPAVLVATDGYNEWIAEEFYAFLLDEAIVYEDDGSALGIRPALFRELLALAEDYGVYPDIKAYAYAD